jgi:hypothetical protein
MYGMSLLVLACHGKTHLEVVVCERSPSTSDIMAQFTDGFCELSWVVVLAHRVVKRRSVCGHHSSLHDSKSTYGFGFVDFDNPE